MEEIKINDYVRTRGIIGKFIRVESDKTDTSLKWYVLDINKSKEVFVNKPYIEKWSKNIKDLVQAGDIVVYKIRGLEHSIRINIVKEHTDARTLKSKLRVELYSLEQINILKILTKEKFESECFKVEV